jgi:adenylate cyclase
MVYHTLGRLEDARSAHRAGAEAAKDHIDRNPDDARAIYLAAIALANLDEREQAVQMAERALLLDPSDRPLRYNVACVYSLVGDIEKALDILEDLARERPFGAFVRRHWEMDSDLDPLRGHPRFEALLKKGK